MARNKKTWREKLLDSKGHPTVSPVSGKMSEHCAKGKTPFCRKLCEIPG